MRDDAAKLVLPVADEGFEATDHLVPDHLAEGCTHPVVAGSRHIVSDTERPGFKKQTPLLVAMSHSNGPPIFQEIFELRLLPGVHPMGKQVGSVCGSLFLHGIICPVQQSLLWNSTIKSEWPIT